MDKQELGPDYYGDIGKYLTDAGWVFAELQEESGMVTVTYSRYVDGKHARRLSSTQRSGSLARYSAILAMQEETDDDGGER